MVTPSPATVEDLYRVPENGKAEIVNGELVRMSPTGVMPGRAGGEIYYSLRQHEEQFDGGYALPNNVGFVVNLPHRKSFSPEVAWVTDGVEEMGCKEGAPVFAVEVRSEGDDGPQSETHVRRKIEDYFEAGTQVVWDVDLLGDVVIRKYTPDTSLPAIFKRGETADAEPAVPGWRMPVDRLFNRR